MTAQNTTSNKILVTVIATLAACIGLTAVTHQSLWIDEANTAIKAVQPSSHTWWSTMAREKGSDLQMPFYMLWTWGWEKIFGPSEWALRAANIPFFVLGVVALAWGIKTRRLRVATVALALTNAFLWYYLSEARPYVFLFAFASVTAACLFRLREEPEASLTSALWFWLFCVGIIGLCAANLIAVPWALAAIAAIVYWSGLGTVIRSAFRFKTASVLTIAALGGLGFYYLWTLQLGARASDVGRTGLTNIAFIFYELLGLAGLGSGRLALRTDGLHALMPFLPMVLLGAIAMLVLLLAALPVIKRESHARQIVFFAIAVGVPFALVMGAGVFAHMRLLGRHFTPLLPYLLALLAIGLARLLSEPTLWRKLLALGAIVIFLLSALEIRFAPRHRRDDYRDAVNEAKLALGQGKSIGWFADKSCAVYYGLPLDDQRVVTDPAALNSTTSLVFLSKPDIYDSNGDVHARLKEEHFRAKGTLQAFTIYTAD